MMTDTQLAFNVLTQIESALLLLIPLWAIWRFPRWGLLGAAVFTWGLAVIGYEAAGALSGSGKARMYGGLWLYTGWIFTLLYGLLAAYSSTHPGMRKVL